jgi:hypothetical protein
LVLLPAAALAVFAIAAAAAKTSTITLHFFQKGVSFKVTDPAGNPVTLSATTSPAPGDVFVATDLDYVGNHKHHAKQYSASDHIRCTFQTVGPSGGTGVCDGQIAIGGSMLLADHVTANLGPNSTSVPLNGGTGKYAGYHGTSTSISIGNSNNSDFTITVSR